MKRRKGDQVEQVHRWTKDGRRMLGYDSKGRAATEPERVSGWAFDPEYLPKHAGGKEAIEPLVPVDPLNGSGGHRG